MDVTELTARRDRNYRRRPELKVRTPEAALEFIEQVGFCFLFPDKRIELPSLWEAICGRTRPIPKHHDDYELGLAWHWKDELPARRVVLYGKFLRRKPVFISLRLLPAFYALSPNYGDPDDYLVEYRDGKLSLEAKQVYEALLAGGAMPTSRLRREAGLSGTGNATRFDRALAELQMGFKIVKTGISDANRWKYCYVYDLLTNAYPGVVDRAQAMPTWRAQRVILTQYLTTVVAATSQQVARLFDWEMKVVERVAEAANLRTGVRIEGIERDHLTL